ncbi:MAG: bifunctional glycosyltransferase family 2 protein/CDP-glycerol:glycerophosphate glycerophosphotransferase [Lachnospiraceae bacterium]|nr:bifunctional glycosyltransferase family 2 protein/CDP-glycerol:glycerophosphate glycerophosphotransferase [Lachnospiraceae bacterium]
MFYYASRQEENGLDISIIVPYHGEDIYVRDCLDSLCEQTYDKFEVIFVASEVDIPNEIIESYKDKLDIKAYHTDASHVSAVRNEGLTYATGEYVVFLDCDDYLDESYISRLHSLCVSEDLDFAFGYIEHTWYKRSIFMDKTAETVSDEEESDEEESEETDENFQFDFEINDSDSDEVIRQKKLAGAGKVLIYNRKSIQRITALGVMFNKSFIEKNDITFPENLKYYSDWAFICKAVDVAEKCDGDKQAKYIKRIHNNPIHFPSLVQEIGKDDFELRDKAYAEVKSVVRDNTCDARVKFDVKLINYLVSEAAPAVRKNEDKTWRKKRLPVMSNMCKEFSGKTLREIKFYKRRVIKAIAAGDIKKICKLTGRKNLINWGVRILLGPDRLKIMKEFNYKHRYLKQPMLDNVVLLESFFGKSYSDSPKYIFEKLNELYPGKYEYVWILDKKTKLPYPAKQIKRFSFAYYKYLARAKYIVFNSRQPKFFVKRKGNIFLETWHGTPLKKLVFDMEEVVSASPMYKKTFYIQSRSWDYLVAANGFSEEVFKRAFVYDKPMLKFGYPRNDILHADDREIIAMDIKKRVGIPKDKKVILYAPTWRDDEYYEQGKYKFDLKLDLRQMQERLSDEYVVILRTHYFIADNLDVTGLEGFVYNLSKYDDIAELYLISDILITDYSSVFFDYANLKRPMLFFTYDLDKYRDVLRGFYIDMEKELPGPLVFTTDEIIETIENIDSVSAKYAAVYDEFYERFCGWEDGHASENCIKTVFK